MTKRWEIRKQFHYHVEAKPRLNNENLHKLYCSINIITSRKNEMARDVARTGEMKNTHRVLVGEPEWKTPLGRQRRR